MGQTKFIADIHFGHKNILKYDNRPFLTVEAHDEHIINQWNKNVEYDDEVWILGDISWHNVTKTIDLLNSLNGIKKLCIGNHDKTFLKNGLFRKCFAEITDYKEITTEDNNGIILSHYPIPCFNHHFHGWRHLYGHVHSSFEWNMMENCKRLMEELYTVPCKMYNVGCMLPYMNYTPQTIAEIEFEYKKFIDFSLRGE